MSSSLGKDEMKIYYNDKDLSFSSIFMNIAILLGNKSKHNKVKVGSIITKL